MEPLKTNNLVLKEKYVNHDSELDGTSQTSMCVEEEPMDDILNAKEKIFHNASNAAHQIPSDDPKRKPANAGGKLQEHNDEEGNSQLYMFTEQKVIIGGAPLLTESMRIVLMNMIRDHYKVVGDKSPLPDVKERKRKVWNKISREFNSMYPDEYSRSAKQIKGFYEKVKHRVKSLHHLFVKRGKTARFKPPRKELVIAASLMRLPIPTGNNIIKDYSSPTSPLPLDEEDLSMSFIASSILPSAPSPPSPGVSTVTLKPPPQTITGLATPSQNTHRKGLVGKPCGHPGLPKGSGTARSNSPGPTTPITKINIGSSSAEPSTSKQVEAAPQQRRRFTAKGDVYSCRRRQEDYHKLKIYQMKEIHALEVEKRKLAIQKYKMEINNLNKMNIALDNIPEEITMVCNAAKRSYDTMDALS